MTTVKQTTQPTGLPASAYHAPADLDAERRAIFAREWLFVGDMSQLAAPTEYVATSVAGYAIIVLNDGGALRAFHNICRHRGGPLLWDGAGACQVLVCRYHGWSYGLDGALQNARDFGDDALPTDELALDSVRVETWRGLVFVNLDASARPLIECLGGFAEECASYPIESFVAGHRSTHHIAANWKLYAENYQEGYHIPLVHPGLNRQIDARQYEVEARGSYSVHRAPTRDGSVTSGVWLWRFPGLALNVYPDGMCVESYVPTGPAATRIDYAFFFVEGASADEIESTIASSNAILDEDRTICEAVQRNMESGAYRGGVISPRHETGVAQVQRLVNEALGRA